MSSSGWYSGTQARAKYLYYIRDEIGSDGLLCDHSSFANNQTTKKPLPVRCTVAINPRGVRVGVGGFYGTAASQ